MRPSSCAMTRARCSPAPTSTVHRPRRACTSPSRRPTAASCATTPGAARTRAMHGWRWMVSRDVRLADGRRVMCRPVFERLAVDRRRVPARCGGGDHRRAGREDRGSRAVARRVPARVALFPQRPRATHERDAGVAGDRDPVRAARRFRPAGRQRARPLAACERREREGGAAQRDGRLRLGRAERPIGPPPRRAPSPPTISIARSSMASRIPVRALVSFGANMLLANGDSLRGRAGARAARVLRADRADAHADESLRRRAAARRELDGILRPQGRPPLSARSHGPRAVPRSRHAVRSTSAARTSRSSSASRPGSASATSSGTATSRRGIATSWRRPA